MGQVSIRETVIVVAVLCIAMLATAVVLSRDGAPPTAWRLDLGSPVTAGLTMHADAILVGTEVGEVLSVERLGGTVTWRAALEAPPRGEIRVDQDRVYVRSDDGALSAFDQRTGAPAWSTGPARLNTAPLLLDGMVVLTTRDAEVVAFEGTTGRERWRAAMPALVQADLANLDGLIVAGDIGGRLLTLDPRTGAILEQLSLGGDFAGPILESSDTVFAGPRSGLAALDPAGRERWKVQTGEPTRLPMVSVGGILLADASPDLLALDVETGEVRWRYTARALVVSFGAGGTLVLAGVHTGEVHGIDLATGERLWSFRTNTPVQATPLVDAAAGRAYFGGRDGTLYAILLDER
ncbi:MAG: PQQ-binding-like beta-propeller repeat protein [Dehalococcoidia bacterium]|nr:PQQ-binding-like beta-propeller repeat protein [Dehalococcoidia bacterium]